MSCDLNSWYLLRRELSSVCPNKEGNAGYSSYGLGTRIGKIADLATVLRTTGGEITDDNIRCVLYPQHTVTTKHRKETDNNQLISDGA